MIGRSQHEHKTGLNIYQYFGITAGVVYDFIGSG